ncbi:MAG TPA: hypothetical protein PLI18_08785 [Pirellulaceae bacterium]|nr:hypothetical protein [Pirellulaceae bacterium]
MVRGSLMLTRRSHLYFGLLLCPWALLYGITAYLFNHPEHFSPTEQQAVPLALLSTERTTRVWSATTRAEELVRQLQERFAQSDRRIRLDLSEPPRFTSRFWTASFEREETSYSLTLPLGDEPGRLRFGPQRRAEAAPAEEAFFAVDPEGGANSGQQRGARRPPNRTAGATPPAGDETQRSVSRDAATDDAANVVDPSRRPMLLDEELRERLIADARRTIERLRPDWDVDELELRLVVPELSFRVSDGERIWNCRHQPLTGAVTAVPADAPPTTEFSWRRFLLRLHTAHGYPMDGGPRWYWAVIVDLMAFVMVFWGVSGMIMWWQIKSTRRWGMVAVACSLFVAAWLGWEMFAAMHS